LKVEDYEFSKELRKDVGFINFVNDIRNILNLGRYQMRIVSSVPTHTGESGEHFLFISGTSRRFYFWDDTNSTWQFVEWNQATIGQATIATTVQLTEQTASISKTTLWTPPESGLYRASVYHVCTTAGTGGTLDTDIYWTDDAQAQQVKPAAQINLNGKGNAATGMSFIRTTAAAISYSTTVGGATGSPKYGIFVLLERLS